MIGEECGIFGTFLKNPEEINAPSYVLEGLVALQHRGQESCGVSYVQDNKILVKKEFGTVLEGFNDKEKIQKMKSYISIGHVRYSTKGGNIINNAQPYKVDYKDSSFSIAHNGQIENAKEIKKELEKDGHIFLTDSDSEVILHILIKKLKKEPEKWNIEEISNILQENLKPSYSLLMMMKNRLIAIRDPQGYRPLSIYEDEKGYYISSEDCGYKFLNANYKKVRDIMPGETIEITSNKIQKYTIKQNKKTNFCFFEHVYFSRPDSNVFGINVHQMRKRLGEECALQNPVDADIVIPVMDSGLSAAIGYSKMSGIPLDMGLMRNRYIGRTFINPVQKDREIGVIRKLTPILEIVKNKRVILVDDSLVRGTTMKKIVKILREAKAEEVHVRISSPKVINVCNWGVDIPDTQQLIAANNDLENIRKIIQADSIGYVSIEGIKKILNNNFNNYCLKCFQR
ncbi:amidophosphoribosyltransferase [Oceanotoga sp. DSM 15011]|jgi:amidophosphoribosyltransferase|uniref:Amidophosphoribosyltransferase n=1 Tax=Oceanotoga teriensis TaxID=515440 RepID=A0AA45HJI6_9BACT|nr:MULTISPECIES: amidophosphoribosyltransferase [Oceanotoga]MDN5342084.1 amidophosphoribosyltransferase [Oceanotoga sp.]MDO7975446.1 amidophosphoribosyltransferase [Oceanotoga teriensis]PWJ96266.1 amidophosphoribosyltransferase [Oceanotoga teriensis]UYP00050.1 amidophosphoribosyltransferase [Oceanotoga sp. DSM 15011]